MNMKERIAKAIQDSGLKKSEIADRVGVSTAAVTQWETRDTKSLKAETLMALATATGKSARWLATGEGPENEDPPPPSADEYAEIPQYDARGSCGNGHLNEHVEVRGSLAFKRDWLMRMGLTPATLAIINAQGDSMAPTINDGAVLMIDHGRQAIEDGRVYAVLWDGELVVKRLFRELGGRLRVVSDNPDKTRYPDRKVEPDESDLLEIVGRVVWQSGTL